MSGKIGHGIIMERGDQADPEVWEKIGSILTPGLPNRSRDTPEDTDTEVEDGYRTFIGGLRDGGEVTVGIKLDMGSTAYEKLNEDYEDDDRVHYRIKSPSGNEAWDFMALINNLEHDTPLDDTNAVNVTFKISGKPSLEDLS